MHVPNGLLPRQLQIDESHSCNYDLSSAYFPPGKDGQFSYGGACANY